MHKKYSLIHSFGYAVGGIKNSLKYNINLRIHFVVAFFVVLASVILQITSEEFILVLLTIILVISTEMINTVVEEVIDLVTTDYKKQAEIAKDVAAGMVLVTALGSVIVGCIIFLPRILALFH